MKKLITILLILWAGHASAQTFDTIPQILPVMDTTGYYLVYNKNGKVVRESSSRVGIIVPPGGFVSFDRFVNPNMLWLKGRVVYRTDTVTNVMVAIKNLTWLNGTIPAPYVVSGWPLPVDGINFKQLQ